MTAAGYRHNRKLFSDYYVSIEWQQSYRSCASDFLAFVEQMLVPLGPPDQVRIVFGFDS